MELTCKNAYEKKFQREFKVFHNFADSKNLPLSSIPKSTFSHDRPLKILFIGSIFHNLHHGSIQDICSAVKEIHTSGKPISFHIYGQVQPENYLDGEIDNISVFHHGEIEAHKRFSIMERYHVFVVPSSFEKAVIKNYYPKKVLHSNQATRITCEWQTHCCLWTPNMEAYNYCKKLNSGILIEHKSIHAVKNSLTKLLENYDGELNKSQSNATLNANNFLDFNPKKNSLNSY